MAQRKSSWTEVTFGHEVQESDTGESYLASSDSLWANYTGGFYLTSEVPLRIEMPAESSRSLLREPTDAKGSDVRGVEVKSDPPSCWICTENLDETDSQFLPCSCGFRICLFCHHRISTDDGRCPGCRKVYNNTSWTAVISNEGLN